MGLQNEAKARIGLAEHWFRTPVSDKLDRAYNIMASVGIFRAHTTEAICYGGRLTA